MSHLMGLERGILDVEGRGCQVSQIDWFWEGLLFYSELFVGKQIIANLELKGAGEREGVRKKERKPLTVR